MAKRKLTVGEEIRFARKAKQKAETLFGLAMVAGIIYGFAHFIG